jgi:outer membrane usher protein
MLSLSISLFNSQTLAQEAEFNNSFLYGEQSKSLNLDRLTSSEKVIPNDYLLDIYLNDKYVTQSFVNISDDPNSNTIQRYCIPAKTVKQLDFNEKLIDLEKNKSSCIDTRLMNHVVFWKLNIAKQRLDISSPQAMLNERPQGYINPELWQNGNTTAFLKYYANYYNTDSGQSAKQNSSFLSLNTGLNFSDWQLRHSGNTSYTNNKSNDYISYETKLLHVLPTIKSQLTLGDFYTNSSTFNSNSSISIRGIQIASDERMLPKSQQNFAPVISGYANTNALIRVRQNQQIIMERTVPAGEFSIQDLQTPGNGGMLNVDIIESNGVIRSFDIPYSNFIQSLRKNQYRYQIAAGVFRQNNHSYNENLINASYDYGLNNFITLNTSILISDHYQSYILGSAFNTLLGGIALEGNYVSSEHGVSKENKTSYSASLRYNLSFNEAKSNLTLNSTLYGNQDYYTFDEIMQNMYGLSLYYSPLTNSTPKSLNYIQYSHLFGPKLGSLSANYTAYNYWDNHKRNTYQINYSNSYKGINYYFGVQKTLNSANLSEEDTQYFFNIDFPLQFKTKKANLRVSSEQYKENSERNTNQIGLFGNLGKYQQFGYSVNYVNNDEKDQITSSMSYEATPIYLSTTFATDLEKQRQYSVQAQGAIIAHQYGLTLANNLGETYAIVHAKGLENSRLTNGTKFDRYGNAVISTLTPYQYNSLTLDSNTIPIKTNVDSTEQYVIPKSNASVLVTFNVSKLSSALISIQSEQLNDLIPMGASVVDSDGNNIATVGQGQQIYIQNIQATQYKVLKGSNESCTFNISDQMFKQAQIDSPFARFNVECL